MSMSDDSLAQKRPHIFDAEISKDSASEAKDSKKNRSARGPTFPPLSSTKRQVILILEYDGTLFKGWQSQSPTPNLDVQTTPDNPIHIPGVKSGKRGPGDPVRTVSNTVAEDVAARLAALSI